MNRFITLIRRPVKRQGAEYYLLFTLLSFAASVTLTRLFLELTGYPQLGGGQLHIAHVLWGGLLLFIAALLPLIIANRWVYTVGSLLAGAGVGLFIDEVGKFITASSDYFYPLAAPIIYASFLLTVLLYLRVRRPLTRDARAELYRSFDALEEVLEHDLDQQERADLANRLRFVVEASEQPELARLGRQLLDFLDSDAVKLAEQRATWLQSWLARWQQFEKRWLSRWRVKAVMAGGLLSIGLVALLNMSLALLVGSGPLSLETILTRLVQMGQLSSQSGLNWFLARVALETTVGLMLLIASGLLIANRDRAGVSFSYWSLLLSLTTVDLLVFYFDQFSAILTALVQFVLLLTTIYYRQRYLLEPPPDQRQSVDPPDRRQA